MEEYSDCRSNTKWWTNEGKIENWCVANQYRLSPTGKQSKALVQHKHRFYDTHDTGPFYINQPQFRTMQHSHLFILILLQSTFKREVDLG